MSTTITTLDVAKRAIELADASPEFTYHYEDGTPAGPESRTACKYVHGRADTPTGGCLFGRALLGLGYTPQDLTEDLAIDALLRDLEVKDVIYTHEGIEATLQGTLAAAQMNQDQGRPWGEAVKDLRAAVAQVEASGVAA